MSHPNERAAIDEVCELLDQIQRSEAPSLRAQHPVTIGCVWAKFAVLDDLPANLRHGLFRGPREHTAIVRFSSGKFAFEDRANFHGMAIKVFDVDGTSASRSNSTGTTQDFLLVDHPVFFASDATRLLDFVSTQVTAMQAGTSLDQLRDQIYRDHPAVRNFSRECRTSLLEQTYWSGTAYRLGDTSVVKYLARSREANSTGVELDGSDKALRAEMVRRLTGEKNDASFDFCVQERTRPEEMSLEDPTQPWPEDASPPVAVATVRVFPQEFDTDARKQFAEDLSFTPWHTRPEHQPLGWTADARVTAYANSSAIRHAARGTEIDEPTGREWN